MTSPVRTAVSILTRRGVASSDAAYWILRVGAALCFIGHGAFGFITKAAWVPYFAVVGIPESWAWRLMPMVGAIDVMAGMAVLFAPRGLPLVYMTVWATWTALLRPLAGEPLFETLERAGNYGVPLALLCLTAMPRTWGGLGALLDGPAGDARSVNVASAVLRWTTVTLLVGHAALGLMEKPMLTLHYASIGFPPESTIAVGWFEMALAVAIAARPATGLLVFAAAWKIATEGLFLPAGDPVWEVVERSGSYAAPLALAVLTWGSRAATRVERSPRAAEPVVSEPGVEHAQSAPDLRSAIRFGKRRIAP